MAKRLLGASVVRWIHAAASPALALLVMAFPAFVAGEALGDGGGARAGASGTAAAGADGGGMHDPSNVRGLAHWMELCVQGNAKYEAHDYPGAIELYKQALRLAPKNAYIYYLLAQGYEATSNLDEADAALATAEKLSDKRDALLRAKVLFVHADLKERQKKWEEARAGWQAYSDWVIAESDGGTFPLSASSRIRAIDEVLRLDKATEIVRQRIAGNMDAGAPPVPPGAGKK